MNTPFVKTWQLAVSSFVLMVVVMVAATVIQGVEPFPPSHPTAILAPKAQ